MAPPQKRRKVVETPDLGDVTYAEESSHLSPHAHRVEQLPQLRWHSASSALRQVPQHIEEVHLQIHHQAMGAADSYGEIRKRQAAGTGASSAEQILSVTVAAAVAIDGSTTAVSTATSSISGSASFSTTATVSTVISTAALDMSASGTGSSSSAGGSASSSAGSSVVSSSSENSTQASTASSTGSSSSASSSTNTNEGFIGNSPSGASSTISGTSTNSTSATTTRSGSLATGLSSIGTTSQNLTTSDYLIISGGKTFTTQTTINLASSTSRTASSDESSSTDASSTDSTSSLTLGATFYLTTLDDGTQVTISRSDEAYATTFANGFQTTIPAATGSYLTTTDSDGSTFTSFSSASPTTAASNEQSATSGPVGIGAGVDGQGTSTSAAPSSTSSAASSNDNNSNNNTAPPGTIAGGVVGGAAGLAVILLIAMLFLRWYRRKAQGGHQALPANTGLSPSNDQVSRGGPGMAERAGLMPVLGAVPALFRHQNRSQDTAGATTERSFERVAGTGRKMPSSFSPGLTASSGPGGGGGGVPPYAMPLSSQENNLSTTSFYRDSTGFYGGEGSAHPENPFEPAAGTAVGAAGVASTKEEMTLSPGPRRTPTVHAPGPYRLSTTPAATASVSSPSTPRFPPHPGLSEGVGTSPAAAAFERSGTPTSLELGGSGRGSRFTEEV